MAGSGTACITTLSCCTPPPRGTIQTIVAHAFRARKREAVAARRAPEVHVEWPRMRPIVVAVAEVKREKQHIGRPGISEPRQCGAVVAVVVGDEIWSGGQTQKILEVVAHRYRTFITRVARVRLRVAGVGIAQLYPARLCFADAVAAIPIAADATITRGVPSAFKVVLAPSVSDALSKTSC